MPTELNQEVLKRLAKLGALARLEQIEGERAAILAAFPDLAAQRGSRGAKAAAAAPAAPATKRRRRHMTAAQRKAVAERMKKYWADRRKTAKGKDME